MVQDVDLAVPFVPNSPRDGGTISEEDACWAIGNMLRSNVEIDTLELQATVPTTFLRPNPTANGPLVLFLHGADFSCLEYAPPAFGGLRLSITLGHHHSLT